jgi:pimeloyl-ACP methyl ester carboxylesterase
VCGPLFVLETPFRLRGDMHWSQLEAFVTAPVSFGTIARRAQLIESTDVLGDCRRVASPTLVITGEPQRDRVVPVENTMGYLESIPGATHAVLKGTGHLGSITHASEFAGIVSTFAVRPAQSRRDALHTAQTDVA